jgi:Cysteine-rich CPXCG
MSTAADIDKLYGLEPVLEIGETPGSDALEQCADSTCPYCGEPIQVRVDVSAGTHSYVEDCQVCCKPMMITVAVTEGELSEVVVGTE